MHRPDYKPYLGLYARPTTLVQTKKSFKIWIPQRMLSCKFPFLAHKGLSELVLANSKMDGKPQLTLLLWMNLDELGWTIIQLLLGLTLVRFQRLLFYYKDVKRALGFKNYLPLVIGLLHLFYVGCSPDCGNVVPCLLLSTWLSSHLCFCLLVTFVFELVLCKL